MSARFLVAFLAVWLVSCGPQMRLNQCSPSGTGIPKQVVPLVLEGGPTTVELLLPPAVFCQDGNPIASTVTTEILAIENLPIAHVNDGPHSSDTRGYSTSVTFTAPAPGVYYVSARFEPALGVARRQVQVMSNRESAAPVITVPNTMLCDEVFALTTKAVCRRGGQVQVISDAGVEFSEAITDLRAFNGVAWWWNATTITRAVELDGGILSRTTLDEAFGRGAINVARDVLTRGGTELLEVSLGEDGGLNSTRTPLPEPASGVGLSRAGTVIGYATGQRFCAVDTKRIDAGSRCIDATGLNAAAGEGDVLWFRGAETGVIGTARVNTNADEPAVRFLEAQASVLNDANGPIPYFTWNGLLISIRRSDLVLEAWTPPMVFQRQLVTADHVVFQPAGQLRLYAR